MIYSLKMFNTGQITLPKSWRKKFNTTIFIAKETEDGLLIQPVNQKAEVMVYKNEKEEGVIFPKGMDPQKIIDTLKEIDG